MATTDPSTPLDLVIRNTCASVAIVLVRVHNLQVEVAALGKQIQELRSENSRVLDALRAVLDVPKTDERLQEALRQDTRKTVSHAYDKKEKQ